MHQIMWILQNGSNPRDCPSWAQQDVAVPALICDNPRLFFGISVSISSPFPLPPPWSIVQLCYKSNYYRECCSKCSTQELLSALLIFHKSKARIPCRREKLTIYSDNSAIQTGEAAHQNLQVILFSQHPK